MPRATAAGRSPPRPARDRAQRVGDVEVAGQRHVRGEPGPVGGLHGEGRAGGLEGDVERGPVGLAAGRGERTDGDGGLADEPAAVLVVDVDQPEPRALGGEQGRLGGEVLLHGGWKSRWSRPRLVKAATSKTTPSTRPMTSAWLETSIAQPRTPRSRMTANSACRSGASGVVSVVLTSTPSIRVPTVPTTAAGTPEACRPPSASRVVVVLPWVPVTATRRRSRAGSPYTRAARPPSTPAARVRRARARRARRRARRRRGR